MTDLVFTPEERYAAARRLAGLMLEQPPDWQAASACTTLLGLDAGEWAAADAALDRACGMLEHYRDRDEFGVYAPPYALAAHLAAARQAIAHAEEILHTTPWPTDEDGDEA